MTHREIVDTDFDLRSDLRGGKDPDRFSPTLRKYHRILWSKALPGGAMFTLTETFPLGYLKHDSKLGLFKVSSDAIIRTFKKHSRMRHVIGQIPEAEQEAFSRRGYSIGGMMIFPRNRIGNKHTINQARGTNKKIEDRFDLTLEAIRRHYQGGVSPLTDVLARYSDFFDLFVDFQSYVDFFYLQDLVEDDYASVKFFAPFDDFRTSALIPDIESYKKYRALTLDFVNARNERIGREHGSVNE
ncbi:hypothetical protein EYE40_07310 [Glaciihabitans arcticus]|uniref:Uncharacterized protein n=2 Tax=Glaciihabitans arcticus TaxID=2668039 RepID=A0A4V2JF92_9MICO|nr:hypothetical protein EYE40_07310 [Glaciihabitans arcticus]